MRKVNYKTMRRLGMFLFGAGMFLFAGLSPVHAAVYYVEQTTSTVDGDTFCGGVACTSADTIIIKGGARGNLRFQDFNGVGSYITITNENTDPDSKVVITNDGTVGFGVLSLSKCKYVDLRGNNDGDITYGIHVINDDSPAARSGAIRVYGESDHIKLGYLEVDCTDNATESGIGIQCGDENLSDAWTFDTFEIHHNYIHDTRYAGMYLGHNDPPDNDAPYISNFSVHDNLLEDLGAYGITVKGVAAGSNPILIYNNTVRGSSGGMSTGLVYEGTDNFKMGIGFSRYYGDSYAIVYNNWIEKTVGPGIKPGKNGIVRNNTIVGCGLGNSEDWGHGIITNWYANGTELNDNIIIQPKRYGIYAGWQTQDVLHQRNLIGDAGLGEVSGKENWGNGLTEGTGDNANIYHSNVADFNFKAWSDDNDYSNDDFTLREVPLPADLNQDGRTDIQDIQLCVNVILETETDPTIVARADVNGDGSVNTLDIQEVVNAVLH